MIYSNFAVLLNVLSIPPGDYNQNGFVDAADYVVWRDTLGQTGAGLAADGNNNGQIDAGDYDLWRANFGKPAIGSSATTNLTPGNSPWANYVVPEPTSAVILLLGLAVAYFGVAPRREAGN